MNSLNNISKIRTIAVSVFVIAMLVDAIVYAIMVLTEG